MAGSQKNTPKNNNAAHDGPAVAPATEIARNPNPRANENLQEETRNASNSTDATEKAGSEITDGEDA